MSLPGYVLVTERLCQVTSWLRNVFARLRPGYGMCLIMAKLCSSLYFLLNKLSFIVFWERNLSFTGFFVNVNCLMCSEFVRYRFFYNYPKIISVRTFVCSDKS